MTGMSPDEDDFFAEVLRVPGGPETRVPPPRYPYPVEHQPPLEQHTLVSTGGPGGWWVIDELSIIAGPEVGEDGQDWYEVLPQAEWGASLARQRAQGSREELPEGKQRVYPFWKRAEELWVYRDAEQGGPQTVEDLPSLDPLAWYARVTRDPHDPPQVLRPRPARELPSMVGRRLRWSSADRGMLWVIGLSEPIDAPGGFVVSVCAEPDYWKLVYGVTPTGTWLRQPPLHTLWTY